MEDNTSSVAPVVTLGDRMKAYEAEALSFDGSRDRHVVLRLDGTHFHTWTRRAGMAKPFDGRMTEAMNVTALRLCGHIPSCVMAYVQSDEISLVLRKGAREDSEAWFGNRVQKLVSVSASMAAAYFNEEIAGMMGGEPREYPLQMAFFDSRALFLPTVQECMNCLIWRQNDCMRNSVSALSQSLFPESETRGKGTAEQLEMQRTLKGVDWNSLPAVNRLGALVHKQAFEGERDGAVFRRSRFFVDDDVPKFSESQQFLYDAYNFRTGAPDGER